MAAKEANTMPSATIPDQTMSLRDMLVRFNTGQTLEEKHTGYFDEEEHADPRSMDLAELQEEAERLYDKIQAIRDAQESAILQKPADNPPAQTS